MDQQQFKQAFGQFFTNLFKEGEGYLEYWITADKFEMFQASFEGMKNNCTTLTVNQPWFENYFIVTCTFSPAAVPISMVSKN